MPRPPSGSTLVERDERPDHHGAPMTRPPTPRVPRPAAALIVPCVALLAVCLGCSSGLGRPIRSVDAAFGDDSVERARIELHSYYFEPNRVVVHAGRTVELTLHNGSLLVPHNLTFADSALSLSQSVGRKRTHRVRFTAPSPGEYEFFCHVGSHAKKGMKGVLVVLP